MRTPVKILATLLLVTPTCAFAGSAKPKVNVNTEGPWQIQHDLRGVTKKIARNIVHYRQQHGRFTDKSQLLNVPGYGRDNLNLNRNYITIGKGSRSKT
jgi:competence ComEA-like helix-hairpin-helix protein